MNPSELEIKAENKASLQALGAQLRARRKALRVSSVAAAEAAGLSRVTLHRIEKGEPTVAIGAWANVLAVLGMELAARVASGAEEAQDGGDASAALPSPAQGWIPVRIKLADYPQLKALAWQVHAEALTPREALGIYERNARHLDAEAMTASERALWQALKAGLSEASLNAQGLSSRGAAHV
jgi:transcriptional regulator with XRE-family HTH domain